MPLVSSRTTVSPARSAPHRSTPWPSGSSGSEIGAPYWSCMLDQLARGKVDGHVALIQDQRLPAFPCRVFEQENIRHFLIHDIVFVPVVLSVNFPEHMQYHNCARVEHVGVDGFGGTAGPGSDRNSPGCA